MVGFGMPPPLVAMSSAVLAALIGFGLWAVLAGKKMASEVLLAARDALCAAISAALGLNRSQRQTPRRCRVRLPMVQAAEQSALARQEPSWCCKRRVVKIVVEMVLGASRQEHSINAWGGRKYV